MQALLKLCFGIIPLALCSIAAAQDYPTRVIRIIAPFGAGSPIDIMGRLVAPKLTEALGQNVIVENRAGAGGMIALEATAKAPKDGYTLALASMGPLTINPGLHSRATFDPVKDFTPVSLLAIGPMVIVVHPKVPARNIKELVALARARPGKLTYGSAGIGSSNHMAGELLNIAADIKLVHVPYKGNAEALNDLLSGEIDIQITGISSVLAHVQEGKIRAIATTGSSRSAVLPDLPTIGEGGLPEAEMISWYGLIAPAGTPRNIVDRLNAEIAKIMKTREMAERFSSLGADPITKTPDEFAEVIREDVAKWAKVIKERGIKVE